MITARSTLIAVTALTIAACGDSRKETNSEAPAAKTVEPVAPEPKAPDPKPASGQLKLSPENTKVAFVGSKMIGSHEGAFLAFSGTVDYKSGDPLTAAINVGIDLASVKTDSEKLDGHLKSPDFFDVEKFPKATFVSTGVAAGGADGATHTVNGEFTLHGVQKAIAVPAKIEVSEKKVSVSSEFTINRKDYGIVYPGMPDNLIKDDVVIKLSVDGAL